MQRIRSRASHPISYRVFDGLQGPTLTSGRDAEPGSRLPPVRRPGSCSSVRSGGLGERPLEDLRSSHRSSHPAMHGTSASSAGSTARRSSCVPDVPSPGLRDMAELHPWQRSPYTAGSLHEPFVNNVGYAMAVGSCWDRARSAHKDPRDPRRAVAGDGPLRVRGDQPRRPRRVDELLVPVPRPRGDLLAARARVRGSHDGRLRPDRRTDAGRARRVRGGGPRAAEVAAGLHR